MEVEIRTPGGNVSFKIPVMKSQKYSIDEIFEKKLYFLIPFVIFSYEKQFRKYNEDKEELAKLLNDYTVLMNRLMEAEEANEISAYTWSMIRNMSKKVVENIAAKYENVKEGVEAVMGGRVLEYEGKRIFNEGRNEGLNDGRNEGENRMGRLMTTLFELGRVDDAKKASKDPEYRSLLYQEFQIA